LAGNEKGCRQWTRWQTLAVASAACAGFGHYSQVVKTHESTIDKLSENPTVREVELS
jgi:hypothetical protein